MTSRGDLVTVSLHEDGSHPRPALVIQSNLLADANSVVLYPITSELRDALFRVTVEPNPANGLKRLSQIMVDKPSTLPRAQVSMPFGRIEGERMRAVERALLLVMGIS